MIYKLYIVKTPICFYKDNMGRIIMNKKIIFVAALLIMIISFSGVNGAVAIKEEHKSEIKENVTKPLPTLGPGLYFFTYFDGTLSKEYDGSKSTSLSFSSVEVTGPFGILSVGRTNLNIAAFGIENGEPVEAGGHFSSIIKVAVEPF